MGLRLLLLSIRRPWIISFFDMFNDRVWNSSSASTVSSPTASPIYIGLCGKGVVSLLFDIYGMWSRYPSSSSYHMGRLLKPQYCTPDRLAISTFYPTFTTPMNYYNHAFFGTSLCNIESLPIICKFDSINKLWCHVDAGISLRMKRLLVKNVFRVPPL